MSTSNSKRILLTSVCRPIGPENGDAPSVGYELLYRQVTRAQGLFSPRTVNVHFSLDYIAENLDAPTVVLQYPSKKEFIHELKKGYDYVGISFLMAVMHKMKEMVALIRQYAPQSKIVLGGYQNQEVVAQELDGLMRLKPSLAQFLIYGPVPGTPFHERIIKDNLLHDRYTTDKDLFYRRADGFRTMIKHPTLSPEQIEDIQRWCFEQDFQRLGPSIYRVLESRLLGHWKLEN